MPRFLIVLLLLCTSMVFSGCILALFEALEMGAIAEEGMVLAEEEAFAMRYGFEMRGARFAVVNDNLAYSLYEDVTLERLVGENPKLLVRGKPNPIGEILTRERKIKFNDGSVYKIDRSIFSVEGDVVNIRANPSNASKIIDKVQHGHLVVNLGEVEDGWFKIEIVRDGAVKVGYVKGNLLTPIIMLDSNAIGYSYDEIESGVISFPNETTIKNDLVNFGIPNPHAPNLKLDGWKFEAASEIKSYRLEDKPYLSGDRIYHVSPEIELKNEKTNKQCKTLVSLQYVLKHGKWKLTSVDIRSYTLIKEANEDTLSHPVLSSSSDADKQYIHGTDYNPSLNSSADHNNSFVNSGSYPNYNGNTISYGFDYTRLTNTNPAYTYTTSNLYPNHSFGTGVVEVQLNNSIPMTLAIDGLYYPKDGTKFIVKNIPTGLHSVKIYSHRQNGRGRPKAHLVFKDRVEVYLNMTSSLTYNASTGQIKIVTTRNSE